MTWSWHKDKAVYISSCGQHLIRKHEIDGIVGWELHMNFPDHKRRSCIYGINPLDLAIQASQVLAETPES